MSTDFPPTPSHEARIRALENLAITFNARIEQLSQDMSASFRQSLAYQEHRFNLLEESLASMKYEILNAFKELIAIVDTSQPGPGQEES